MVSWKRRVRGSPNQIGKAFKVRKSMNFDDIGIGKMGRRSYGEIAEDLTHEIDVFYRDEQNDSEYMKDLLFDYRYKKVQRMLKTHEKLLQHGWDIGTNASLALKELKRRYTKLDLGKIYVIKSKDLVKVYLRDRSDYDKLYRVINDVLEDEYHQGILADEIVAIEMDEKLWKKIEKRIKYEEQ